MKSEKILVDRDALIRVLVALTGPHYKINYLQAIRDFEGNSSPINKLIADYLTNQERNL